MRLHPLKHNHHTCDALDSTCFEDEEV